MTADQAQAGISKAQIEDLKERIRIEDIVKRYVKLKPVGKNLFGVCPFHSEKTPSFSVNSDLNLFKCYGCGEGGDVISFIQKVEALEFREALEFLAKEAGVTLKFSTRSGGDSKEYTRAKEAHLLAAQYFRFLLNKHPVGAEARTYVDERGLSGNTQMTFMIGYAPPRGVHTSLVTFLARKDFSPAELVNIGLASKKESRIVDKFVDRLMFPIFDHNGTVIGFTGRVFRKNDDRPKYLNSPESIIFQKRRNLYGLNIAKKHIRTIDRAIFVEGTTDVISSWSAGVPNVVAPLGTGITEDQLDRLKRYSENISVAFDDDNAGRNAHLRLAILAFSKGFSVFSVRIPKGKDPDECIRIDPEVWKKAANSPLPTISFFLDIQTETHDNKTLEGKQAIVKAIAPLMNAVSDPIIYEHHLEEISTVVDVPVPELKRQIPKLRQTRSFDQPPLRRVSRPQERLNDTPQPPTNEPKAHIYETHLLALISQFPNLLSWSCEKIPVDDIQSKTVKKLVKTILETYRKQSKPADITHVVISTLDKADRQRMTELLMRPLWTEQPSQDELCKELNGTIKNIREHAIRSEITQLKRKLTLSEQRGETRQANISLNQIHEKVRELEALHASG